MFFLFLISLLVLLVFVGFIEKILSEDVEKVGLGLFVNKEN